MLEFLLSFVAQSFELGLTGFVGRYLLLKALAGLLVFVAGALILTLLLIELSA